MEVVRTAITIKVRCEELEVLIRFLIQNKYNLIMPYVEYLSEL